MNFKKKHLNFQDSYPVEVDAGSTFQLTAMVSFRYTLFMALFPCFEDAFCSVPTPIFGQRALLRSHIEKDFLSFATLRFRDERGLFARTLLIRGIHCNQQQSQNQEHCSMKLDSRHDLLLLKQQFLRTFQSLGLTLDSSGPNDP